MTLFAHPERVEPPAAAGEAEPGAGPVVRRPGRWSVRNWPVRWKVLAIALVPMLLAMMFGGLRAAGALAEAGRLRLAADRAEMIPVITNYMSALDNALVATSSGGDAQGAKKNFENRKYELQSQLTHTDVADDVRAGVTTLVEGGQGLLDLVLSGGIGLRDEVTRYAPILLTAEDAINGSVRLDDARMRARTEGLSRAVGARGQMMMQELLVNRGGEMPDPELRTSMMTLAGTEPSTLFGMSEALGVSSPAAKDLQQQMVTRMAIMSNPESVLPDNPVLRESIRTTDGIAAQLITSSSGLITKAVEQRAADRQGAAIRDIVLTLVAIGTALVVVALVARSLVLPLRILRDGALRVAHTDLEEEIARVRAGAPDAAREPAPLPVYTTEEVGQVAHAVDELHAQALLLAGDEARLRRLVNEMFETMSRRNRSLVDQQLTLIDRLERNEDDPDRLDSLFRLDHLAARMRRNGANLLVLAGARSSQERSRSVPLATVISAAISEVEGYHRVQTVLVPDVTVAGAAVGDTVHLLAELIDNALRYSPPEAPVRVVAGFAGDTGAAVEVVDVGLGMTPADLRMANMRLGSGGEVTPENARRMGLFVVSRLARRHGIQVRLAPPEAGARGITAEVYLPPHLLVGGVEEPLAPSRPLAAVPEPPAPQPPVRSVAPGPAAPGAGPAPGGPTVTLLPQRTPGSSGITGVPADGAAPATGAEPAVPAAGAGSSSPRRRPLPQPWWESAEGRQSHPEPEVEREPADTSAFFAARARVEDIPAPQPLDAPALKPEDAPDTDTIYQRMLSEALSDPHELGRSSDLDWQSVWDHGWSVAGAVADAPVAAHTEHGLPVREPGVRLVPGSAEPDESAPERDPEAVRASIGGHFGGVRAGRSHARHTSSPDINQGSDQQ